MESTGTILMYHRVAHAEIDPWGMCAAPENFSDRLEIISDCYSPMMLHDFVAAQYSCELPETLSVNIPGDSIRIRLGAASFTADNDQPRDL